MMKIAIIAATGTQGACLLHEAVSRNFDVTAIVRNPERLQLKVPYLKRDISEITRNDLDPFDVVISAFGVEPGFSSRHLEVVRHYLVILKNTGKRLLIVGSGGHLYIDQSRTVKYYETTSIMRSASEILERSYKMLVQAEGFEWTYFAPAIYFNPSAPRTGHYHVGTDVILRNQSGSPEIGYADYAAALIDEIEMREHVNGMMTAAAD